MVVMKRSVLFACLIAIMISTLMVPVNQTAAYEPSGLYKLTPFTVSLSERDFDKFQENGTPILLVGSGKSEVVHVRIENHDVIGTYEIKLHVNLCCEEGIENKIAASFDRSSVTVAQSTFQEISLMISAKSNFTGTGFTAVRIAAESSTFGATGTSFIVVFGDNVTEYDTSWLGNKIREGLPGSYFYLDREISTAHLEEILGSRIYLPSYVPAHYDLRGVVTQEAGMQLVYSIKAVTNETDQITFWREGGMVISYNKDPPDFRSELISTAYEGGRELSLNGFNGTAIEQRNEITITGETFTSPAVITLFKDDFGIELKANFPLEKLLKVASSLQLQTDPLLSKLKVLDKNLLLSFDENERFCCISLAMSPDGEMIAYSMSALHEEKGLQNATLWIYDIKDEISRQIILDDNLTSIYDLEFSKDGKMLLFATDGWDQEGYLTRVYTYNLSDNSYLECGKLNVRCMSWMTDSSLIGSRVVLDGNNFFEKWEILLLKKDGSEHILYTIDEPDTYIDSVKVSPDGTKIAYQLQRAPDPSGIYVVDLENGRATNVAIRGVQPSWSSDSEFLIYNEVPPRRPPIGNFWYEENHPLGIIKIVDIHNNQTSTLVKPENGAGFYDVALSPDGSKLVYSLFNTHYHQYPNTTLGELGIHVADLSLPIPEFPVNLMVITAAGVFVMLVSLRYRR